MKGFCKAALAVLVLVSCGCRSIEKTSPHVTLYVELNFDKYGTLRVEASTAKGITIGLTEKPMDLIAPAKKK